MRGTLDHTDTSFGALQKPWAQKPFFQTPPTKARPSGYLTLVPRTRFASAVLSWPEGATHSVSHSPLAESGGGGRPRPTIGCWNKVVPRPRRPAGAKRHGSPVCADPGGCAAEGPQVPGEAGAGPAGTETGEAKAGAEVRTAGLSSGSGPGVAMLLVPVSLHSATLSLLAVGSLHPCVPLSFHLWPPTGHPSKLATSMGHDRPCPSPPGAVPVAWRHDYRTFLWPCKSGIAIHGWLSVRLIFELRLSGRGGPRLVAIHVGGSQ